MEGCWWSLAKNVGLRRRLSPISAKGEIAYPARPSWKGRKAVPVDHLFLSSSPIKLLLICLARPEICSLQAQPVASSASHSRCVHVYSELFISHSRRNQLVPSDDMLLVPRSTV
jgi:hypothetical protein